MSAPKIEIDAGVIRRVAWGAEPNLPLESIGCACSWDSGRGYSALTVCELHKSLMDEVSRLHSLLDPPRPAPEVPGPEVDGWGE